jgi:two-component system, NarL family, response regulator NreC
LSKSILIVDDHEAIAQGIQGILLQQGRYEVAGIAVNGREAIDFMRKNQVDIIIMDISMPDLDGIEATKEIKTFAPQTAIIIYTMYSESEWVLELFKLGISGYVMKDGPLSDLLLALESVERGASYFAVVAPTVVAGKLVEKGLATEDADNLDTLSRRELEVFKLLADGGSIKSIADNLNISPRTVEAHKYNIMKKLEVTNLSELIKLALKYSLIQY